MVYCRDKLDSAERKLLSCRPSFRNSCFRAVCAVCIRCTDHADVSTSLWWQKIWGYMYLSYCHNRHSNIPASCVCKRRRVSCVPLRMLLGHLRPRLYVVYTLVNLRHSKHFLFKFVYVYVLSPQTSQYVFTFLWIHIFVICGRPPKWSTTSSLQDHTRCTHLHFNA